MVQGHRAGQWQSGFRPRSPTHSPVLLQKLQVADLVGLGCYGLVLGTREGRGEEGAADMAWLLRGQSWPLLHRKLEWKSRPAIMSPCSPG